MKKQIYIYVILFVSILMSCVDKYDIDETNTSIESDKVILTPEEYVSIAYDNPKELSDNEIIDITLDFQRVNMGFKEVTASKSSTGFVINKYYLNDQSQSIEDKITRSTNPSEQNVPIYEVELSNVNNGRDFAIVSGDGRVPKVLFYVNNVDSNGINKIEVQYLMALAKRSVFSDIETVEKIKSEKRNATLNKVSKELKIPREQITDNIIKERVIPSDALVTKAFNPIGGVPVQNLTRLVSMVGPLSSIGWKQEFPYNTQMPIGQMWDGNSAYTGHYDVGCANIGVATLFSIIKPSMVGVTANGRQILIDWDYVTSVDHLYVDDKKPANSSPARMVEMVGALLRQIYNGTKSKPVMGIREGYDDDLKPIDVNVVVETTTVASDMLDYLKTMVTYSGYTKFNSEQAMQSLQNLKPVLLFGTGHFVDNNRNLLQKEPYKNWQPGHAWLIDGYCMTKKSGQATNDLYWSVNMGWGINSSKVYFKTENSFQDCDVVFQYFNKIESNVNIVYYSQEQSMIYNVVKK